MPTRARVLHAAAASVACLLASVTATAGREGDRTAEAPAQQAAARPTPPGVLAVIAAEDSRAVAPAALDLLKRAAAGAPDLEVQRTAVRALGRLERPDLLPFLAGLPHTADPVVRVEVANAMAQSVARGDGAAAVQPLIERLALEGHPLVRGVVAASLGRLALADAALRERVAAALLDTGWPEVEGRRRSASPAVLLGVLRGTESFAQRHREVQAGRVDLATVLRDIVFPSTAPTGTPDRPTPSAVGIATARYRAMTALMAARAPSDADVARGMADPDPEIRRLAAGALARLEPYNADHAARALGDAEASVRLQALRALSRRADGRPSCEQALAAARDPVLHVQLLGVDLVGGRCRGSDAAEAHLVALLGPVGSSDTGEGCRPLTLHEWHRPGAALVALAQTGTIDLERWLPCFLQARPWRPRAAAARALAARGEREALVPFFEDQEPNVRATALELVEPGNLLAVRAALLALGAGDYELLLVAANKLQGATPNPAIGEAVAVGSSRVDLQACKLEYSIVSPK